MMILEYRFIHKPEVKQPQATIKSAFWYDNVSNNYY